MILKQLKNFWQPVCDCPPSLRDIPMILQGVLIALLFGRLFYDSWIAVAILLPVAVPWYIYQKKLERKRNIRLIGIQFRDAISAALTSMKAGYSVENSFREAQRDMELLYGKNSLIWGALSRVNKGIANNVPVEKLIYRLGKDSGNADIQNFAEVFAVAKRSGGNMTDIISRTIVVISRKMDVEKEIDVLISAKRTEARIMNMVPFFIILYISVTSPGFFEPLYHNLLGIVVMTVCVVFYTGAYLLSERIVNIDV